MIQYAEKTFAGTDDNGNKFINISANETTVLQDSLAAAGYTKGAEGRLLSYSLSEPVPEAPSQWLSNKKSSGSVQLPKTE